MEDGELQREIQVPIVYIDDDGYIIMNCKSWDRVTCIERERETVCICILLAVLTMRFNRLMM